MSKYELSVSEHELKAIFKGLGKLPFEDVFQLIEKLNLQIREQASDKSGR